MHMQFTGIEPTRAHATDAGYDLYAAGVALIRPRGRALIETGTAVAIPDGFYGDIRDRSSMAWKRGLHVGAGVIDSGFRDTIKVLLFNMTDDPVHIDPGERIAQLIVTPIVTPELVRVEVLPDADRGMDGFGSTGR